MWEMVKAVNWQNPKMMSARVVSMVCVTVRHFAVNVRMDMLLITARSQTSVLIMMNVHMNRNAILQLSVPTLREASIVVAQTIWLGMASTSVVLICVSLVKRSVAHMPNVHHILATVHASVWSLTLVMESHVTHPLTPALTLTNVRLVIPCVLSTKEVMQCVSVWQDIWEMARAVLTSMNVLLGVSTNMIVMRTPPALTPKVLLHASVNQALKAMANTALISMNVQMEVIAVVNMLPV